MPTGGVNAENVRDYLAFDKVICVGGTWVCGKKLVREKNWTEITRLCREACELTR